MNEAILETVINSFVKELIEQSKEIFSDIYDEGKHFVGKDLRIYLEKQKTKYSYIKTLLRGNTPVYLYDIYFPINLRSFSDHKTIKTDEIRNTFTDGNYITIIGDAGSGKSTLTKHLFLNSIKNRYGIPILIEFRYLNETGGDIEKYILEKIFENKISLNFHILERLLKKGKFVFFLDGFDELNFEIKNNVVKNLNTFINIYDENKYILTSRPYSNAENFPLFRNLKIKELDRRGGEIDGFIDLQKKDEMELAEKIKKSLKDNKSEFIESFLTNPLLLSLYILTFQNNAEIPDKKYIFYRRVINALFSEHDSKTKLGYVREKHSKLNQEKLEEILRAFCFLSFFSSHYDFDFDYINETLTKIKSKIKQINFDNNDFIYDLKSAIALWTEDNGIYAFAHRSLQEYFAASFIKNLNPVENQKAYSKILERFTSNTPYGDVENLLSLCSEMDSVNYNKFCYLPAARELLSLIDETSEITIAKSFVLYFTDGFLSAKRGRRHSPEHVNINNDVFKSLFVHMEFARKLFEMLTRISYEKSIKNHPLIIDSKFGKGTRILRFDNDIPNDVFDLILASPIKVLSAKYVKFLKKEIKSRESMIQRSITTDRELLDLI